MTLAKSGFLTGFFLAVLSGTAHAYDIEKTYILNCAGCHGMDGTGLPANYIPDFRESGRFTTTGDGREYLIQVPGVSQAHLTNAQVADMMNWILHRFSHDTLPADFQPYTAEEVARLRPDKARDAVIRRAELRERIFQGASAHPPSDSGGPQ